MTHPVLRAACLALVTSLPSLSAAQSLDYAGFVEYDLLTDGVDRLGVGVTRVDFASADLFGGIGVEGRIVGLFGNGSEFGGALALTYSTDFGKFSFGLPMAAGSDLSRLPALAGSAYFGVITDFLTGDAYSLAIMTSPASAVGLRFDGALGAADVAVSTHVPIGGGAALNAAAVDYQSGNIFVAGSVQGAAGGPFIYHVEAGSDDGTTNFGVGVTGEANFASDQIYMAWLGYSPMQALDLSAVVLGNSFGQIYGLSARYDFASGLYGTVGAATESGSADEIYNLGVGFAF